MSSAEWALVLTAAGTTTGLLVKGASGLVSRSAKVREATSADWQGYSTHLEKRIAQLHLDIEAAERRVAELEREGK